MKIFGMVLVLFSCSGIGIMYGYLYKKRVEELEELKSGISFLKNEIFFSLMPLPEAFEIVGSRMNGAIKRLFTEMHELLKNNHYKPLDQLNENSIKKMLSESCLNGKDKNSVFTMIKSMGSLDKDSQMNHLEIYIKYFENQIEKARREEEKNNKLFKTLGILSGIFIIVIFI